MSFPRPNMEQTDEIHRLVLIKFQRPTKRTWEMWDMVTQKWQPASPSQVKRYLRAQVDLVTKLQDRPQHHYDSLYSDVSLWALKGLREQVLADLQGSS